MQTEENGRNESAGRDIAVLTVVLRLPDDPAKRSAITSALRLGGDFMGAHVTAASMEDEITVNEFLEEQLDEGLVQDARRQAKALHREM
jgi:hypothetical protein